MSQEDVRVRAAVNSDLDEIARIYAHYVTNSVATFEERPWDVKEWSAKVAGLAGLGLPCLVATAGSATVGAAPGTGAAAETETRVVGYAYVSPWRPKPAYRHTVEDSVFLAPGWTGRGIGGRLLRELIAQSTAAGARQMIAVIADAGNDASALLHRRLGFADAGRLASVGFKHGRWIDTLLLQRELSPGSAVPGPAFPLPTPPA
ncbi:MAG TPA: GNAT family N-acetyltransferase [Trebonia sp.]|jgi:L-amino acid N-acyltransferase YncA|nr:GNAT family N-acetyltransferase [Trebonia sp.]